MTITWQQDTDARKSPYLRFMEESEEQFAPPAFMLFQTGEAQEENIRGAYKTLLLLSEKTELTDAEREVAGKALDVFKNLFQASPPRDADDIKEALKEIEAALPLKTILLPKPAQGPSPYPAMTIPDEVLCRMPTLPDDAVITGVIDDGINPFHQQFRKQGGTSTRVLAHWEQQGRWAKEDSLLFGHKPRIRWTNDESLPFGREIHTSEINEMLEAAPTNDLALCRKAGLIPLGQGYGPGELSRRFSHGMHVADLAAGHDPAALTDEEHERFPLITVNIPARSFIGFSGAFLELYAARGIARIVMLADALWARRSKTEENQWPIIINLSYGQSAGARDASALLPAFLEKVNEHRAVKVKLVMPAGNNNLDRGHARLSVEKDTPQELSWRILPQDSTANYCEIWTDPLTKTDDLKTGWPLRIGLISPDGAAIAPSAPEAGEAAIAKLGEFGYIFVRRHEHDGKIRFQFVIALRPTFNAKKGEPTRAGLWRIHFEADRGIKLHADIQVDLAPRSDNRMAQLSYFDDEHYQRFDEAGRIRDFGDPRQDNTDDSSRVRQRGTLNSLTNSEQIQVIAGYRGIDGQPWAPSACGGGNRGDGRDQPTCAFPAQAGPAGQGILAAGTLSGSSALATGTSMAAAQAARVLVEKISKKPGKKNILESIAKSAEDKYWKKTLPNGKATPPSEKIGAGRAPAPKRVRIRSS